MISLRKSLAAVTAVLITVVLAGTASAATWNITKPGKYKLPGNRTANTGDAIVITASNVTLDLQGYTVSAAARGTGRGIAVEGAKNVTIHSGHVSGFSANVAVVDSQNVKVEGVQVVGDNLAPNNGPTEIGILLINSRACDIVGNSFSSVNLGIFIRGGNSAGNRIMKNIVNGGANPANNLLGICYNPAPTPAGGVANPAGPRGDSIYNNHIARFGFAIAVSAESVSNMFNDNTLASFTGGFREPQFFVDGGGTGTNIASGNTVVTIPSTTTP